MRKDFLRKEKARDVKHFTQREREITTFVGWWFMGGYSAAIVGEQRRGGLLL